MWWTNSESKYNLTVNQTRKYVTKLKQFKTGHKNLKLGITSRQPRMQYKILNSVMDLHRFVSKVWSIHQYKGVDAFHKLASQFSILPDYTKFIHNFQLRVTRDAINRLLFLGIKGVQQENRKYLITDYLPPNIWEYCTKATKKLLPHGFRVITRWVFK